MGCNCKNEQSMDTMLENENKTPKNLRQNIIKYTFKSLGFLFILILLPILNLFMIWLIFKMFVLNEKFDIMPLLITIGRKLKPKNEDDEFYEDEDEYDNLTEDDVILVNAEDITNK
jgi:hypothetical protein